MCPLPNPGIVDGMDGMDGIDGMDGDDRRSPASVGEAASETDPTCFEKSVDR